MDMEHHTIFVSTLGRCVRQYADINNRIREREELYMLQSIQLENKSGCMQQVLQEMEARKENAPLANIKMKQKMEKAEALMSALPQKLAELYDGIQQEMAKKGSLLSEIIQVLKEVDEEWKNGEMTAKIEMQKKRITKLQTLLQEVTSENSFLKNKSGAFVILKTDFQNGGDPPIWKIDGNARLQKYVPFEQDGKTLYKNTSTYSGWSANNKEMYYPAPIVFKMQNQEETIVEFLKDAIKEDDSE